MAYLKRVQNIGGLSMIARFEVDARYAAEAEVKHGGGPHSQRPEHNARAAGVATSRNSISSPPASESAKSPARRSFTPQYEAALWASENPGKG